MLSRRRIVDLIQIILSQSCKCPVHTHIGGRIQVRRYGNICDVTTKKEYAYEMVCTTMRYGVGVTKEVGMDIKNMRAKKTCLMTDANLVKLAPVKTAIDSLNKHGVCFEIYDQVRVEPTEESMQHSIDFAKCQNFDAFIALGGGSVMDTCKVANLYQCDPKADFLDYVSKPVGKGKPIKVSLKPLIAIPTTSGTGSEASGISVFDHQPTKTKSSVSSRALFPTLAIIDPVHTLSLPERVTAYAGFDVLCSALETFTALPYTERTPRPEDPLLRTIYQGSTPLSDIWARYALQLICKYFERSVYNQNDLEARSGMHVSSTVGGVGFATAGVHLCHALSYGISMNPVGTFQAKGYTKEYALVPHGLSVVITAPAVFTFTASACPDKHLEAAELLGADIKNTKRADAGKILADTLRKYMCNMKIENGLSELGFTKEDIPALVKATMPQQSMLKLAPIEPTKEDVTRLIENSFTIY